MDPQKTKWKIRCVTYDCDGVLFDSTESNTRFYNDLCLSVGRSPLKKGELRYVRGHSVFETIHFLFGPDDRAKQRALTSMRQVDLKNYVGYLKMEPDLLQTLDRLKENGMIKVIKTNRTITMKYIMERFDLWPYFEMVVMALDVKNPKPHPESIDKILQAFRLCKEEVVFVGDSKVDLETAWSSGIKFIAYKNGAIACDASIDHHPDLLNLIANDESLT